MTNAIRNVLIAVAAVSLFGWLILNFWVFNVPTSETKTQDSCTNMEKLSQNGLGFSVTKASEGEPGYIGVSDGSFIFDTVQNNNEQKCQGAVQFRQGDENGAQEHWTEAVILQDKKAFQQEESNDAEALIYRENSHVLKSSLPYITFIIGTILTGDDKSIGHNVLQGAYVAQEEFSL